MKQLTLTTSNTPLILDSTCSFKKAWPRYASIRIDIRPETNPDVVMDARDLKFPDSYFDIIYSDPPHLIRKGEIPLSYKKHRRLRGWLSLNPFERYSYWKNNEEWYDFIEKTNKEFYRCLKKDGLLYYKMTEARGCTKIVDLIERMSNFEVVEDKIKNSNTRRKNPAKVHYITFKPRNTKTQEGSSHAS